MKVNGLMLKPMVRRQNGVPRLARPPRNLGFDPPVVLSQGNIGRNQGEYPLSKLSVGQEPSCRLPGMWPPNGRVMQLVPDLSVFTDSESVERRPFSSARSRTRPERGQKCLGSPPWLDDHGKHPAQEGGSAIARRGRETCVFIIIDNLDPAFVHARPGTFVRVATVQAT
jgi:hypothetical protein